MDPETQNPTPAQNGPSAETPPPSPSEENPEQALAAAEIEKQNETCKNPHRSPSKIARLPKIIRDKLN